MDNVSFVNLQEIAPDGDDVAIIAEEDPPRLRRSKEPFGSTCANLYYNLQTASLKWRILLAVAGLAIFVLIIWGSYETARFVSGGGSESTTIKPKSATSSETLYQAEFVRNMTLTAWAAYKEHTWGHTALEHATSTAQHDEFSRVSGHTLITAMSTLWIMNLTEEFEDSKLWVRDNLNLTKLDHPMNVGVIVNDYIGGLLSCYALTGEKLFLEKALEIAKAFAPAYKTETGLPYGFFNPHTSLTSNSTVLLGNAGGQQLEYNYLVHLLGDDDAELSARLRKMRHGLDVLANRTKDGLYMEVVNIHNGEFAEFTTHKVTSFSWLTTKFYICLVKSWLQTGLFASEDQFLRTIRAARKAGLFARSQTGLLYVSSKDWSDAELVEAMLEENGEFDGTEVKVQKYGRIRSEMQYHACCLGGLLMLTERTLQQPRWQGQRTAEDEGYETMAVELTETCYQASRRSGTGLAPLSFDFDVGVDATNRRQPYYAGEWNELNPELAETYFILWRYTHGDLKYRQYAWEMVQAIYTYARTANGAFMNVKNVNRPPMTPITSMKWLDYQPAHLFATFKYLYLIFQDDSLLPLDQWIFNTIGHPLPIIDPVVTGRRT